MANTDLDSIAQRLDRIEQALAKLSFLYNPTNPVVDPAPDDLGHLHPEIFQLRLIDLIRNTIVKGDPPPRDLGRLLGGIFEARLSDIQRRGPIVDPAPDDLLNSKLLDLIRRWRGGTTDPVPEDLANVRLRELLQRIPGGGVVDPGPEDIARLSKQEVEQHLHRANAEVVRLQSFTKLLNERLGQLEKG
jgi:hypothetical protein